MHAVRFIRRRAGQSEALLIEVPDGTSLLAAVKQAGLPIAQACGSETTCARCGVELLEGASSVSPEGEQEARVKIRNRVAGYLRLACTCAVHGEVTVTTSYW